MEKKDILIKSKVKKYQKKYAKTYLEHMTAKGPIFLM